MTDTKKTEVEEVLSKSRAVRKLKEVFKARSSVSHSCNRSVVIETSSTKNVLVMNIEDSRAILGSKFFSSINHSKAYLNKYSSENECIAYVNTFFNEGILYKEGVCHHKEKVSYRKVLQELDGVHDEIQAKVKRYFEKRTSFYKTPLEFSEAFTRVYIGLILERLTGFSIKKIFRALSIRKPVFHAKFEYQNTAEAGESLRMLYAGYTLPEEGSLDWLRHVVAQSLLVMGVDPILGTICAKLVDQSNDPLSDAVYKYSAVSFVSRECIEPTTIGEIQYNVGDHCYLSLLPSEREVSEEGPKTKKDSIAFGLGVHKCSGEKLSLTVLRFADEILEEFFHEGFPEESTIMSNDVFLAFEDGG